MVLDLDAACAEHARVFLSSTADAPNERFLLALDQLLPKLTDMSASVAERIRAAFLLHAIYAPVSIELNPFRTALADAFSREKARAGGSEQLVFVLWKLVSGAGDDLGPRSPNTLASAQLSEEHKPARLRLAPEPPEYEAGMSHSGSLVNPDDSLVGEHNAPKPRPVVGVIGEGKTGVFDTANGLENDMRGLSVTPRPAADATAHALDLLANACSRVLTLAEQRTLKPHLSALVSPIAIVKPSELAVLVQNNPSVASDYVSVTLSFASNAQHDSTYEWTNAIARLPPTLHTFDFVGRLLRDETPVASNSSMSPYSALPNGRFGGAPVSSTQHGKTNTAGSTVLGDVSFTSDMVISPATSSSSVRAVGRMTVGEIVRVRALGAFVSGCIAWVERAEREEHDGLVADDRVARSVSNLSRFFASLVKLRIVDVHDDAQTAEMAAFALAHSRFEDALAVYRLLTLTP